MLGDISKPHHTWSPSCVKISPDSPDPHPISRMKLHGCRFKSSNALSVIFAWICCTLVEPVYLCASLSL
ncbi:hypothetical protein OPV43_117 [Saccharomyces cerevisiae synthetic construct]|uniref:Putative uncharacterized protein YCR047W-A n=2 Tax=Saccharomyces cerevisiae TaxID=4932 RepID=YC047_YEAST|nr:RecName: Full=Putative uncharacterized protein YCR047W-A [Saccharomyces cerevisiae S288C]AAL79250.1 unknown [Saccharomyces cerevisiae]AHV79313.1 hypothetical protein [synthetic construct]UZT75867.1 hypothetical protein OPV43_117 [Saccharomyces cerevisiae synthetic construct]CAY78255.1 EC1118_1C17_1343p [Saccharomyces cerevisiae EC1118]KZV12897.1 hypothetical protein WN66_00718 [Saccharomyces cerevisiae]